MPVTEVIFRHDGQKHSATVSADGLNATFVKDPANVADAGIWTCSIRTKSHGSATGDISVFLRPVVVSNFSLRIDEKETNKAKHHASASVHTFEASGITVISGEGERDLDILEASITQKEARFQTQGWSALFTDFLDHKSSGKMKMDRSTSRV